jgi:hypothetical protein
MRTELMPVCFLHLNIEMTGGLLQIGKRQIPLGVCDLTDLIEPRHRVANMRRISHRFFARTRKGEGRGRQRSFVRRGKMAMRCRAIRSPSGGGHNFIFHNERHGCAGRADTV